ncbi:flagellar hook protein FlgE [Roseospira visakhapatnamensis]|uniref:Flagellar hook protein FlgE n=1 Tax=Roseospira visakhapatnamensis TaxID=390880 RepID=A0A7W6W9I0_9PROT|nr:flagellar hook protein FlgE [Roseospira visakhapatnamensis]
MSSLSSSMNIAVTALNAQSAAVSSISNNLANSQTIGYKSTQASFYSLVTGTSSQRNFTGGGVIANPAQNIAQQGMIIGTENDTDMAIDGDGFFAVTTSTASDVFAYTRAGDFFPDDDGYLVNSNGYFLQGYPTDEQGVVIGNTSPASLEAVNIHAVTGTAVATSDLALQANLPATAAIGDTLTTSVEIFDSLGVAHTVTLTYEKTAINTWDMTVSDPVLSSDGTTVSGTTTPATLTLTFDDGRLDTASADPFPIAITGWTTGASDSAIAYDPGTSGLADGLSQYAPGNTDGDVKIEVDRVVQNGVRYGAFYSSTVTQDGLVYANFDNGVSYPIYQVPLGTFTNVNGLEAISGNAYLPTTQSGTATFVTAGTAGSGAVFSGSLESSTVDTADEFSKLITAQQAYSAASEVIQSAQEMFDDIINAKR